MSGADGLLGLLAVVAGAVAAVAGFGIGSLLTPALAILTGAKVAVAVVAVPHAVATAARLWMLRESVDRRVLMTFGLASAAGGILGALLHSVLAGRALAGALGVLLVLAGLLELTNIGRRIRISGPWSTVAGILSGAFGGLVGNQGGIRSAALLHFDLERRALVATATATALMVDVARLPVYLLTSGADIVREWPRVVLLTAGVLVGTVVGAPVLRRTPERVFRGALAVALIALGIWLIAGFGG